MSQQQTVIKKAVQKPNTISSDSLPQPTAFFVWVNKNRLLDWTQPTAFKIPPVAWVCWGNLDTLQKFWFCLMVWVDGNSVTQKSPENVSRQWSCQFSWTFENFECVTLGEKTGRLGLFWQLWHSDRHFNFCLKECMICHTVMQKSSENVTRQLEWSIFLLHFNCVPVHKNW
jgi:hypothetical protein